jgi:hypothetical protein
MARTTLNALLDALAALLFLAMVASGFIVQLVLPPGSGKTWALWSIERHDWARAHSIVGAALVVVVVVHVALHWKWVVEVLGRRLGRKLSTRSTAVAVGLSTLVLSLGFVALTFATRARLDGLAAAAGSAGSASSGVTGAEPLHPTYARDVAPLLAARCTSCHGPGRARGGVRLDQRASVLEHVVGSSPDESPLVRTLARPELDGHQSSTAELELLRRWIADGAPE